MATGPQTWHYGLVARWWSEFNVDGPEIEYFRRFVEEGQPALDVGCGTGRLLLPYLRAGLDVDGCDVSADMIALCREKAAAEGLSPTLFVQPMHELAPPRAYRTIYVCGAFGVGSDRTRDTEALRRFFDALEPGGTLVLDNEAPYADSRQWRHWLSEERRSLPEAERAGRRRRGADGAEYELRSRLLALEQSATYSMHALMWSDGELVGEEEHQLQLALYFKHELVLMLERAGFGDVTVRGGYDDAEPTADHEFLVFVAHKPARSTRQEDARSLH
ncbi:MAG TPA: class I SAM-dependent methyltransferase [Gaiellaceae bacterium]